MKTQLLRLGSRLKRRIHVATTPRSGRAVIGRGQDVSDADRLIKLLFPDGLSSDAVEDVRSILQSMPVTPASVRHVLGSINRLRSSTPFSVRLSEEDVTYKSIDGIEVALDKADQSVSAPIIRDGLWEPHVESVLRRFLQPGSVFVDIGANVGWHTALASSIVGANGVVYAIEPNTDNARLIAHTIERNGLSNVRLMPFALGESTGFAAFRPAIGSNGGFLGSGDKLGSIDPNVTIVPTMRFDDLVVSRIDVVKIDVEGAEPIVFRGATQVIERDHPVIIFEFSLEMTERVGGVAGRAHLEFLESFGYELSLIDRTTGSLTSVGDIGLFLSEWGDPTRIEDFVAVHSDANNRLATRRAEAATTEPSDRRLSPILRIGGGEFRLCTSARSDTYFDQLTADSLPTPVRIAEAICPSDAVIVDVGANLGLCALAFSYIAPQGRILAVEPGRRAAADLHAAIELNQIRNIEVIEVALGAERGQATLIDPTWNASGAFISHVGSTAAAVHEVEPTVEAQPVEVQTLDDLVSSQDLQRLDLLKIDVEGYESDVLAGAVRTLERFRPVSVIEFNPFTLSVMASENPLHFLVKMQARFPHVYAVDAALNIEPMIGDSGAYSLVSRCFNAGQICDLICSFEPFPDVVGRLRPIFSPP